MMKVLASALCTVHFLKKRMLSLAQSLGILFLSNSLLSPTKNTHLVNRRMKRSGN